MFSNCFPRRPPPSHFHQPCVTSFPVFLPAEGFIAHFTFCHLIFFPLFAQGLKVSQNEWIRPWLSSFLGLSWACTQPYICVQHFRSPGICLVLQDFLLNSWSGSCLSWNHSLRQQLDTASRLLLFLWCPRG